MKNELPKSYRDVKIPECCKRCFHFRAFNPGDLADGYCDLYECHVDFDGICDDYYIACFGSDTTNPDKVSG